MALLFMDGFDAGDWALKWPIQLNGNIAVPSSSTTTRFGVGRSMYTPGGNGGGYSGVRRILSTSFGTFYMGFAFMTEHMACNRAMVVLTGDNAATPHLSLSFSDVSGALQLRIGNYSTVLATSAASIITTSVWRYIEIKGVISDTVGTCEIRVDGEEVINYSGDTRNGGTTATIDSIAIQAAAYGSSYRYYYDDLYLCDGSGPAPYNNFLGDVRVQTLAPNGAGSSTQFTPSAGANFETVDELPYSTTDYVESNTAGHKDLYTLSNISTSNFVFAIGNNVIAKKADAGTGQIRSVMKSGLTTVTGATVVLGSSDSVVSDLRVTDPDTSTGWTASGVNALESGMEAVG